MAVDIINQRRVELDKLIEALQEKETLYREGIEQCIGPVETDKRRVKANQKRQGSANTVKRLVDIMFTFGRTLNADNIISARTLSVDETGCCRKILCATYPRQSFTSVLNIFVKE